MARIRKRNPAARDALLIAFLTAMVVIVTHPVDAFEVIAGWSRHHEVWHVGEFLTASLFLAFTLAVFAWLPTAELRRAIDGR